jgi:type IV pilus assembly protein PilV
MLISRLRDRQRGASLIEVLIALGLVAVTMLGLLALQLRTMGLQKDSLDRRAAAVLVSGFADRVAVNFTAFRAGAYNGRVLGPTDLPPASGGSTVACSTLTPSTCTPAQAALREWELFQMDVRGRLPNGVAFINSTATDALITVGWLDPRRAEDGLGTDPVCAAVGLGDDYRCYAARVTP